MPVPFVFELYKKPVFIMRVNDQPNTLIHRFMTKWTIKNSMRKADELKLSVKLPYGDLLYSWEFEQGNTFKVRFGYPFKLSRLYEFTVVYLKPRFAKDGIVHVEITAWDISYTLSRIMKERNWWQLHSSQIASLYAKQHNLRSVIEPSNDLDPEHPFVQTTNTNAWRFLRARAEEIGFECFIKNRTLFYVSDERIEAQAPVKSYTYKELDTLLLEFTPSIKQPQVPNIRVQGVNSKEKEQAGEDSKKYAIDVGKRAFGYAINTEKGRKFNEEGHVFNAKLRKENFDFDFPLPRDTKAASIREINRRSPDSGPITGAGIVGLGGQTVDSSIPFISSLEKFHTVYNIIKGREGIEQERNTTQVKKPTAETQSARIRLIARAKRKSALERAKEASATVVGEPDIEAGTVIRFANVAMLGGDYVVSECTHSGGSGGTFTTKMSKMHRKLKDDGRTGSGKGNSGNLGPKEGLSSVKTALPEIINAASYHYDDKIVIVPGKYVEDFRAWGPQAMVAPKETLEAIKIERQTYQAVREAPQAVERLF